MRGYKFKLQRFINVPMSFSNLNKDSIILKQYPDSVP